MSRILEIATTIHKAEEGHTLPAIAALLGAVGLILLGIGAANDSGGLAIAGGIIAAVGVLGASFLNHTRVEYDIFGRLEKLEKK